MTYSWPLFVAASSVQHISVIVLFHLKFVSEGIPGNYLESMTHGSVELLTVTRFLDLDDFLDVIFPDNDLQVVQLTVSHVVIKVLKCNMKFTPFNCKKRSRLLTISTCLHPEW